MCPDVPPVAGEREVSIRVSPYGGGWLGTAYDGAGETLVEATGPTQAGVADAVMNEAGSYLAGEGGWDDDG